MRTWAAALLFVTNIAAAGAAAAQESPALATRARVIASFDRLMCGSAHCTPATPEEIATPPLSDEEARLVFDRGVLSGMMQHCSLDWERGSFLPMMAYWRANGSKSVRQLALIGGLHGAAQRMIGDAMKAKPCTNELKTEVQGILASTPIAAEPPELRLRAMLLVNLDKLRCGNAFCAPATLEEINTPPISDQDTKFAFERGLASGAAQHCGLGWEQYLFRPMMQQWQGAAARSEREIVLFIAVHAMAQKSTHDALAGKGACTPETRRELEGAFGMP